MSNEKHPVWQGLMDLTYNRWQENDRAAQALLDTGSIDRISFVARRWSFEEFLEKGCINEREREAVMLGKLNQQVQNGGWMQWIDSGYGPATFRSLLGILPKVGPLGETVKKMLVDIDDACLPIDTGTDSIDEDGWQRASDRMERFDSAFYNLEGFEDAVEAYLVSIGD